MAELKFIVTMDTSQFTEGANKVMADVKQITSSVEKEGGKIQNQFDGIGKSIGGTMSKYLAMFGGAAALKGLLTEMVNVRSEFQKTDVAIRTMLGSKEKADELMNEVREYAKISPLEFGDITKATQMMISFNIEATKVPQFIKAIGDVSMGEKDRFNSLALAFSQMSATGKLMGQDLLQMINAGFNPLATISDKTGKSIAQLKDEMSKGAISAKMVQDAFIAATSAGGKFYGMSENAAKTIGGQLSMLSDAVAAAFNEVGEQSEGIITKAISGVTTLVENYEKVAKAIGILIATYGTYKAALITMMAIEQAHGVAAAAAAVKTELLAKKQAVLNAVMNANPYAFAAAALATLVGAIVSAATATDAFDDAAESLSEAQASIEAATSAEMSKLDTLNKKLIEAGEGTDEYKKIKQQIIDQYSQYYAGLETEWAKVGSLAAMYDKLTFAIRKSIAARQMKSIVDKQLDATDKIVQDKLDKAYKKLIEKYGNERGTELYKKFFEFATLGNGKGLNAKDWKDLEDATMWTVRWGKNATDGIVDFRVSVKELAYDIQKANKASRQFVENLKSLYDVEEEAPEPTTPEVITPTYDTKATAAAKKAAERAAKERERQAREQAKEREKLAEIYAHQLTDEGRRNADIEFETRELEIKALKDGTEKTIREIELSHDKELSAITRWYEDIRQKRIDEAKKVFDAKKANEGKNFFESEEYKQAASQDAYTQQEKDALKRRLDAANKIYKDSLAEIPKIEQSAMREYLKQYGTYQQKRLAIAREYSEKIATAETEGERLAARAQQKEAEKSLAFEQFKKSINWEAVFSDLDGISLEHLNKLRDQLQRTLKEGSLSATDYKTVVEQINNIETSIVAKQNEWKEILGLSIPALEKKKQLEKEAADATERSNQLAKEYAVWLQNVSKAKAAIQGLAISAGVKLDAKDIKLENADEILAKFDKASPAYEHAKQLFDDLQDAETGLNSTTEALGDAMSDAALKTEKAGKSIKDTISIIRDISDKVSANMTSLASFVDNVGLGNTGAGLGVKFISSLVNGISEAMGHISDGNYAAALDDVSKTLSEIAAATDAASDERKEAWWRETVIPLINANKALERSINELTNAMKDASPSKSIELFSQIVESIKESEKNTRNMMEAAGAAYDGGFLGIRGSHSSNKKIDDEMSAEEWSRISKIVGKTITSAGEFWSLTSKQMYEVAKLAPEVYGKIQAYASAGYQDASAFMDSYIEYWKMLEDVENAYVEKLTSISLDTVKDDFKSLLLDMDSSSADFAKSFEDYMRQAIISALVADNYDDLIRDWYKHLREAAETDGIDKAETDALRAEWDAITKQAMQEREMLREQFGWGSTGEGSGAYKAASSFSQEQGDELNGRLTAIQIGQAYQNEQLTLAVMTLQSMSVVGQEQGSTLAEMRNLMLIGNGHLEDIARYTRIASQFGAQLDVIAEKIKTL